MEGTRFEEQEGDPLVDGQAVRRGWVQTGGTCGRLGNPGLVQETGRRVASLVNLQRPFLKDCLCNSGFRLRNKNSYTCQNAVGRCVKFSLNAYTMYNLCRECERSVVVIDWTEWLVGGGLSLAREVESWFKLSFMVLCHRQNTVASCSFFIETIKDNTAWLPLLLRLCCPMERAEPSAWTAQNLRFGPKGQGTSLPPSSPCTGGGGVAYPWETWLWSSLGWWQGSCIHMYGGGKAKFALLVKRL